MKPTLERRLEALETRGAPSQTLIVVQFVAAEGGKPVYREPVGLRDSSGWSITRKVGESVEAMIARAKNMAPRNAWGVASLVETYA